MNTTLNHYNRRTAPRLTEVIPLVLNTSRNTVESGRAINISSSGMRLVVHGALAHDEEVTLYFHLRGESSEVLEVCGRAVWQEKLGSFGTHVVGLAFHDDKEPRGRISRWMKHRGTAA